MHKATFNLQKWPETVRQNTFDKIKCIPLWVKKRKEMKRGKRKRKSKGKIAEHYFKHLTHKVSNSKYVKKI